jgi:fructose 1,6-bisphosphate aldolase/phosphatase
MKTTITAFRADLGGVGGHLQPSLHVCQAVSDYVNNDLKGLLVDADVSFTGDDITVVATHQQGCGDDQIHAGLMEALYAGARQATEEGLYGAGQDLSQNAFSGAVKGLGPGIAELSFEERPNEAFMVLSADKTRPGAFNLPLYLAFADPMTCSGLLLSKKLHRGFRFAIMDVAYTTHDRVVTLDAPEDLYDMAALLRSPERFAVEAIFSRTNHDQTVSVSTARIHNVAGYVAGQDDPVAVVRVQDHFPSTGEILAPYAIGPYVPGFLRGSHSGALLPVRRNTGVAYFDGPPVVSGSGYSIRQAHLSPAVDLFDHPFWDHMSHEISEKTLSIRRQGFFGNAMLAFDDLARSDIIKIVRDLDDRFVTHKLQAS